MSLLFRILDVRLRMDYDCCTYVGLIQLAYVCAAFVTRGATESRTFTINARIHILAALRITDKTLQVNRYKVFQGVKLYLIVRLMENSQSRMSFSSANFLPIIGVMFVYIDKSPMLAFQYHILESRSRKLPPTNCRRREARVGTCSAPYLVSHG